MCEYVYWESSCSSLILDYSFSSLSIASVGSCVEILLISAFLASTGACWECFRTRDDCVLISPGAWFGYCCDYFLKSDCLSSGGCCLTDALLCSAFLDSRDVYLVCWIDWFCSTEGLLEWAMETWWSMDGNLECSTIVCLSLEVCLDCLDSILDCCWWVVGDITYDCICDWYCDSLCDCLREALSNWRWGLMFGFWDLSLTD